MSTQFKYLFTPIEMGPITVRNRIYMPPMQSNYADTFVGLPTDVLAYYHAERAKGGIGLNIIEASMVHPKGEYFPLYMLNLYDERVIPPLKKLADMVHENGAKVICEMVHSGSNQNASVSRLPNVSSSPIPGVLNRITPKELEEEEIEEIVDAFAKSAKNVVSAGIDGVELHATHGYLIQQFYSPLFNKRTDKYGGPLENRMRFMFEIIDRIRETIGSDFVLSVRLCADELLEGGVTIEDGKVMAQKLEATGKVDFLDIDATSYHLLHLCVGPMYAPPANLIYSAAAVKEVVKKIPVGGVGRINDPVLAESILAEGKADMVGMARAHLADPELSNKAREGRVDDIRPCIGCCQGCIERLFVGLPIGCVVNPITGKEKEWGLGTLKPAAKKKKVIVVGGGSAGMEAARVAALRGHDVSVYEKENELGGQVNLAAKLPGREEFGGIARWLKLQLERLGVKVVLGKEVTTNLIEQSKPDVVIIATGATSNRTGLQGFTLRPIKGWNERIVTTVEDILTEKVKPGKNVVVVDDDGGIEAPGIAEFMAERGSKVEIITRLPHVGLGLVTNLNLPFVYERIMRKGVKMSPNTFVKEIRKNSVIAYNVYTQEEWEIGNLDNIVIVTIKDANNRLYKQLKGKVKELYPIGNCVAPRRIDAAIHEGHKIGRMV